MHKSVHLRKTHVGHNPQPEQCGTQADPYSDLVYDSISKKGHNPHVVATTWPTKRSCNIFYTVDCIPTVHKKVFTDRTCNTISLGARRERK